MLEQADHRGFEAAEGALLNLISYRRDEELLAAARRGLVAIDGPPSIFEFVRLELEQVRDSGRDFFGLGLRTSMGHTSKSPPQRCGRVAACLLESVGVACPSAAISLRQRRSRDTSCFMGCPPLQRRQSHTLLWFASEANQDVHALFAVPSPFRRSGKSPESELSSLASWTQQSKHPRPAVTAEGDQD